MLHTEVMMKITVKTSHFICSFFKNLMSYEMSLKSLRFLCKKKCNNYTKYVYEMCILSPGVSFEAGER